MSFELSSSETIDKFELKFILPTLHNLETVFQMKLIFYDHVKSSIIRFSLGDTTFFSKINCRTKISFLSPDWLNPPALKDGTILSHLTVPFHSVNIQEKVFLPVMSQFLNFARNR